MKHRGPVHRGGDFHQHSKRQDGTDGNGQPADAIEEKAVAEQLELRDFEVHDTDDPNHST